MNEAPAFTATIPTPPSTNNLFANGKHGRFKSKKYEAWIVEAGKELLAQKPQHFAGRVEVQLQVPRNLRRDLDNHWKASLDLLVSHGVIQDDRFIERLYVFWHDIVGLKTKAVVKVMPA